MTCHTQFSPNAKGWVVRTTRTYKDHTHTAWWFGPHHGWGTTSGGLDYSVAVFPTKKEATAVARRYGVRGATVERVADAVAFEIAECDRRKEDVLASDRPDRQEIADANDRTKAYLQGKVATRR